MAEAKTKPTRAEEVMSIEQELLELYRDPTLDAKPELLEQRGGAYYSEAAAQLIASLSDDRGDVQVVDVRNDGALPGLADDDVVEVPARIDRDGAHPLRQAPWRRRRPTRPAGSRLRAAGRRGGDERRSGDRPGSAAANPLAGDPDARRELLEAILSANRQWLPRFFPDG